MKVGDLIKWRSTGCHGVITKIERSGIHVFVHMLCSADDDGDGGGEIRAFHQELVEAKAEVISARR
jgi:hypothetical protein